MDLKKIAIVVVICVIVIIVVANLKARGIIPAAVFGGA